MPVRRIPMSHRSLTGRLPLGDGGGSIRFESALERDFAILSLFDPSVVGLEEQPVRIPFRSPGGGNSSYVPDFLVRYRDGCRPPFLCEVKYAEELERRRDELQPKFDAAEDFASARNWRFGVMTEREIRTPRLENAKFLTGFRDRPGDPGREARLLLKLADMGPTTADGLLAASWTDADERLRGLPSLWRLIAIRRVGVDLDLRIVADSPVWPVWGVE